MGNENSSPKKNTKKGGGGGGGGPQKDPTSVLVFGSPGVGKRSVWLQAVTNSDDGFSVAYDDSGESNRQQSMRIKTSVVGGVTVQSVFASCENATDTILTARFKQARVFVLVFDVCDRESFLDVTAASTNMDVLSMIQATRRDFPSKQQKIFLVGNKTDAYGDREVWDSAANAEAVESLNKWRAPDGCRLGKISRAALRHRLKTSGRKREVSRDEARNLAVKADMLYFETSAVTGEGVAAIREALEEVHFERQRSRSHSGSSS